jgi:hypothetical protein
MRQGREKQLEGVKVDIVWNLKRQAIIQHYHSILSGPIK